jgi:hypothetical protein
VDLPILLTATFKQQTTKREGYYGSGVAARPQEFKA